MSDAADIYGAGPGGPDGRGDAATAGEYALGLLPPDEARTFSSRMRAEPALQSLLAFWQERFALLAEEEIEPVKPPRSVRRKIHARLFETRPRRTVTRFWQTLGGLVVTAAAAGAIWLAVPSSMDRGAHFEFSAELGTAETPVHVVASYDEDRNVLTVERLRADPGPQVSYEMWVIEGENAPVSLGLLPPAPRADLFLPADLGAGFAGSTFAISEEPIGGSQTGAPTGEILGTATFAEL
ncbi:anti-sigma factor [Roseicyclus sp. F158]|uniref:Anti-sigma factor n=1 Tax=Tropicimonas omnivorans TaxID=3075590 RepID=A0ABU3DG68_9RHOB|nr:anti-sigma factor [Roseicyclus sp. F158]MDT0682698.1 anti-sigma factor [Roseicyclus sp. F158]